MYKSALRLYITGFVLSIILTIIVYLLVVQHIFSSAVVVGFILSLAMIQLGVQLFFFLHLGQEAKPRWNLIFFISTTAIILIVVIGSLWIMHHLNTNMTPQEMKQYIHDSDRL